MVVRLKFTKYGHDGVLIESRRNADAWNFLAIDHRNAVLRRNPAAGR